MSCRFVSFGRAGLAVFVIATLSCGGGGTEPSAPVVPVLTTVMVAPSAPTVIVGSTQQLTATTLDAGGATLTGRTITWTTSDATKATVTSTGLVTAVAAGTATITATSEGKSGTSVVTVVPPAVALVAVSPSTASLQVGVTQQFAATVRDANGNALSGRTVVWSSSNPSVAPVNSSTGLATGAAAGSTIITATSEGVAGSATVTIQAYTLTVARLDGVNGSPAAGTTTLAAGAVVPYDFTVAPAHENLRVLLDGNAAPASGSLLMTANHSLAALSDKTVTVVPSAQAQVDATAVAMRGMLSARPMDGYRASNAAIAALSPVVSPDSLARFLRVARLKAFAGADVNALALAVQQINDSLSAQAATNAQLANGSATAAPADVTYIYVNGINTIATSAASTAQQFLPSVLDAAGYADRTAFPIDQVYNPTGNATDINEIAAQVCLQRSADAAAEGIQFDSADCDARIRAVAGKSDLMEAYLQVVARSLKRVPVTGTGQRLADAIASHLRSSRVVVIAHSQGNLFANESYRALEKMPGISPSCVGTVSLAPPVPIQPMNGAEPVSASIVAGNKVKDVLLEAEDVAPGTLPGIRTIPSNGNALSNVINAEYDARNDFWDKIGSLGLLSLENLHFYWAGGITLHSIDNDYLGSNRATTVSAIQTQSRNVLTKCISRLDVGPVGDGQAGLVLPAITVRVLAPGDALATQVSTPVTVALLNNPVGATLSGTTHVTPVNGVATFSDLVVSREGVNFSFMFVAAGVSKASSSFTMRGAPDAVASVTVSPATASIAVGGTQPFTATLKDASGNTLTGRTVTWSTSNASIAIVNSSTGVATAIAAGTATITATSEGKAGTSVVTVSPGSTGPTVVTTAATNVTPTKFRVNGSVNPNGMSTSGYFEWSADPALATLSSSVPLALGSGTATLSLYTDLIGATCGSSYYFRMAAVTASGAVFRGAIIPVTTGACVPGFIAVSLPAPSNLYFVEATSNGSDWYLAQVTTPSGGTLAIADIASLPDGRLAGVTGSELYTIDKTTGAATSPIALGRTDVVGLGADPLGVLYASTGVSGLLLRGSLTSGLSAVGSFGSGLVGSGDLAFAPGGVLYGTFVKPDGSTVLGTVNTSTGAAQVISQVGSDLHNLWGLSFVNGVLFGVTTNVSGVGGSLVRIDPATGLATFVRNLSFGASGSGATVRALPTARPTVIRP